jgi:hypothetical protein
MSVESVNALSGMWAREHGDRWLITDGHERRTLSARTWPKVLQLWMQSRELRVVH